MTSRRLNRRDIRYDEDTQVEDEMSEDWKKIVEAITVQMDALRAEFREFLQEKDKEITALKEEVTKLKTTVSKLEEKLDDADAYERRDTLIFSGPGIPAAQIGENSPQIICDLIKNKLNLSINRSDLSTAHRVGKKAANQQPDRRKLIAKLCRRDLKVDVLNACKQLKPDIYVSESLTPIRNTIMFVLRRAKRMFPKKISGYNTNDGNVYVWMKPSNPSAIGARDTRALINTRQALEEFCTTTLGIPLTDFVERWPY